MSHKIDDILAQLEEAQEKTAEQVFTSTIAAGADTTKTTEEKTASTEEPATPAEPAPAEVPAEKTASEEKPEDKPAEKTAEANEAFKVELVKMAGEMGKIAAYNFFQELVALGVHLPSNADMEIPPVSATSRPQASPVTIAGNADIQEQVGHDGFDMLGAMKANNATRGAGAQEKTASLNDVSKNIFNKLYSPEDK